MANHRSGTQPIRFARWVWVSIVIVIILSLLAGLSVVIASQKNTSSTARCDRTTTLNILVDPAAHKTAEELTSHYSQSHPSTHDSCINPKITYANTAKAVALFHKPQGDLPAAWIPAGTPPGSSPEKPGGIVVEDSDAEIDASVLLDRQQLGFLAPKKGPGMKVPTPPSYPHDSTWAAYAASAQYAKDHPSNMEQHKRASSAHDVAAMLSPTTLSDAVASMSNEIGGSSVAAPQPLGSSNTTFSPLDNITVDFPLLTMTSSPRITEYQARAAADFAEFARSHSMARSASEVPTHEMPGNTKELADAASNEVASKLPLPTIANSTTQLSRQSPGVATTTSRIASETHSQSTSSQDPISTGSTTAPLATMSPPPASASTLLLVDTSESMRKKFDVIQRESIHSLSEAGRRGRVTSLWSFSSPRDRLQPYRDYVDLSIGDHGTRSASMAQQLTIGGDPYLYESVVAAILNASMSGPAPTRVVIVTDSTDSGHSLDLANARLQAEIITRKSPVQVDVLAVGENVDPWLREISQLTHGSYHMIPDVADSAFPHALMASVAG